MGPFRFSGGRQLNRSRRVARHVPFRASKLKNLRESWPREHLPLHRASLTRRPRISLEFEFRGPTSMFFRLVSSIRPLVRPLVRSLPRGFNVHAK